MSTLICKSTLLVSVLHRFTSVARLGGTVQTVLYRPKNYTENEKRKEELKHGRQNAIEMLQELLGVRKSIAIDMVMTHNKLCSVTGLLMVNNYQKCQNHGITLTTCVKYPSILATDHIEEKLMLLKELPHTLNQTVPLAVMDMADLHRVLDFEKKNCNLKLRVTILNRIFGTSPDVIYNSFVKRPFLMKIDLKKMEDTINLLQKNGVTTDEIINDWWVLQYNILTIQERIDLAKNNNVDKIKTWMIRSKVDILENYSKRRSENKLILGDNTLAEYLSGRLECSVEQAKYLMLKLPALKNKSTKKIEQIIDFLYSEGFKPYHIYRVPKILLHSVETTQKRIRELEKQGMEMDSLHMLTKSQRQYMQYYEALVKSNKNKLKSAVSNLNK